MRQTIFTTLILVVAIMSSCKKDNYPDQKQYDQQNVQNYINANGFTGMKRDTVGGDTTGIYYQILSQEPTAGQTPVDYPDHISFVFTVKTLDGSFTSTDTLAANHFSDYLGHVTLHNMAYGLELAIKDVMKYRGTRAHIIVPSRLAYGVGGYNPSGGSSTLNNSIKGNESLDFYVNLIDDQAAYDDLVIRNYMAAQGLTGLYTKTASGLYYRLTKSNIGTDPITFNSTVTVTYTQQLLTNYISDQYNTAGGTPFNIVDLVPGVQEGLQKATTGALLSLLIPSGLGYGENGSTDSSTGTTTIPSIACLRFEFQVLSVNP